MEEQQKNIDEIFRQSLGDYREAPPAAAWEKLSARLEGEDDHARRGFFMRWRWMFMMCLLLTGCTGLLVARYYINRRSDERTASAHFSHHNNIAPESTTSKSSNISTTQDIHEQTSNTTEKEATPVGTPSNNSEEASPANKGRRHSLVAAIIGSYPSGKQTPGTSGLPASNKEAAEGNDGDRFNSDSQPDNIYASAGDPKLTYTPSSFMHDTYVSFAEEKMAGRKVVADAVPAKPAARQVQSAEIVAPVKIVSASSLPVNKDKEQPSEKVSVGTPQISAVLPQVHSVVKTTKNSGSGKGIAAAAISKTLSPAAAASDSKPVARKLRHPAAKLAAPVVASNEKVQKPDEAGKEPVDKVIPASGETDLPKTKRKLKLAAAGASHAQPNTAARSAKEKAVVGQKNISGNPAPAEQVAAEKSHVHPMTTAAARELKPGPVVVAGERKAAAPLNQPLIPMAGMQADTPKRSRSQHSVTTDPLREVLRPVTAADSVDLADTAGDAETAMLAERYRMKHQPAVSLAGLAGYEIGTNDMLKGRVDLALRFLWHFNNAWAFGVQPSLRIGSLSSKALSQGGTFQRSNLSVDSFKTLDRSPTILGSQDTIYNYVVKETFDSIVVGTSQLSGAFYELELPLILSYQINKAWRAYGGPSFNFGGRLPSLNTYVKAYSSNKKDSLAQSVKKPISEFNNYFGTTSSLPTYSSYQFPSLQDPASVRIGYMLGVGYQLSRVGIEASMRQQLSGYKDVAPDLKKIFSSPYIQIGVSYYIIQPKNRPRPIAGE